MNILVIDVGGTHVKLLATGANPRTAMMSGIATSRMIVIAHVLSGGLAAVAA